MTQSIAEMFRSVAVTEPRSAGGLTVFGLRYPAQSSLNYTTLDDALGDQSLTITEVSEGGSVPTLKLINKSGRRVFLMAGEQLIGSKQNRVLNTSLLVEVGAEIPIPVSCVEQGRWSYRSREFGSHGTSSHGKLRAMLNKQVTVGYDSCAAPSSNQSEVWSEVSRKMQRLGSRSDSMALEQAYDDHRRSLDDAICDLEFPEGCSGAVFVRNGQVVGADLFDQPDTLRKLWLKLLRAQLIDALEESESTGAMLEPDAVRQWLDSAAQAEAKSFRSPALGDDVRLKGDQVVGAGLVVDEQPVHVQVFAE
jgi:hypothetical protein